MKKIVLIAFALLTFSIAPLISVPVSYLIPYQAANGVPMDSPFYQPVSKGWKGFGYGNESGGNYDSYMELASGGIRDIEWKPSYNKSGTITLNITLSSPAGMNYVSLSNPHISRPFEVYVVLKHSSVKQSRPYVGGKWTDNKSEDGLSYLYPEPKDDTDKVNFKIIKFDKSGQTISVQFPFRPLTNSEGGLGEYFEHERMNPEGMQKIWFDICLVLPGVTRESTPTAPVLSLADENNYITLANGKKLLLAVADDYSSALTIDVDVSCSTDPSLNYSDSIIIPMNGVYDGTKAPQPNSKGQLQVSIIPTSACNNLDLMKQQGQYIKIADVAISTAVKKRELQTDPALKTVPVYLFVSSSPSPFEKGGQFVLKHRQAPEFGEYNTRNHMKYNVMLYQPGKPDYYEYDGTMSVDASKAAKDYLLGTAAEPGKAPNVNKTVKSEEVFENLYFENDIGYQKLSAELGIIMEDKQGLAMIKGAYTSRVYVHVISDEAL